MIEVALRAQGLNFVHLGAQHKSAPPPGYGTHQCVRHRFLNGPKESERNGPKESERGIK